jgi:hypothetical protein
MLYDRRKKLNKNIIEPLYMQGPNPLGPIEFSVRTLFSGFEFMLTRDTKLRNNLFHAHTCYQHVIKYLGIMIRYVMASGTLDLHTYNDMGII